MVSSGVNNLVVRVGIEPTCLAARDFKSRVYTSSTIGPYSLHRAASRFACFSYEQNGKNSITKQRNVRQWERECFHTSYSVETPILSQLGRDKWYHCRRFKSYVKNVWLLINPAHVCHSRESGNLNKILAAWIPAFAGMTITTLFPRQCRF